MAVGIRNVGIYSIKEKEELTNQVKTLYTCVNMELTDKFGKDLEKYDDILKKNRNPINKNFINLIFFKKNLIDNIPKEDTFILNDNDLPINDKNLGIFETIMNLFDRIVHTPKEEFVVNNDYINSDDCLKVFIKPILMERPFNIQNFLTNLHTPRNVKAGLSDIMQAVQDSMMEYMK